MKLLTTLITLSIFTVLSKFAAETCTTPKLRKEIRELTEDEYNRYIKATLTLNRRYANASLSIWEKFTKVHDEGAQLDREIHGTPAFLPWHRKFIKMYELELQKIDPSVNLPYWDWSQDADEPHLSIVLTSLYMGGNGNYTKDRILDNGPFNNTQLLYVDDHLLRRDYDQGDKISPFASTTDLKAVLANKKFSKFATQLEDCHGPPHVFIGNWEDFGMNTSPNDPLFYLHHAFIDLLWAKWQDNNSYSNQYEGDEFNIKTNSTANLFYYNTTVASTLNYKNGSYCYNYPAYPRTITPVRTNKLVARDFKNNGLIDDPKLNSLIKDLTFEQAIAKLESLEQIYTPTINKTNARVMNINKGNVYVPKRTPLPERWIVKNNLNLNKVREFEGQQIKIRQLFKKLLPIKDQLKK